MEPDVPAFAFAVEAASVATTQGRPAHVSAMAVAPAASGVTGAVESPTDQVTRGDTHYEARSAVGETRLYMRLNFALVSLARKRAFRLELAGLACDSLRSQPGETGNWPSCGVIGKFIERPEHLDPVNAADPSAGMFDFVPAALGPHHCVFTMLNAAGRQVTVSLTLMVELLPMPVAAFSAPKPNWIGDTEPDFMPAFVLAVRGGATFMDVDYSDRPNQALPTLTMRMQVPYSDRSKAPDAGYIEFAALACANMDIRQRLIGSWGPECRVEAIRHAPSGRLVPTAVPRARPGSFAYTPTHPGLDRFEFVLANGAGRRIRVIAELRAYRHEVEEDSPRSPN
jgi:hypothetical protein